MKARLTLQLDDSLIRSAKRHSMKSGKSVSRLVADYFALIETQDPRLDTDLTPRVQSLFGALAGAQVSERDYRRHSEERHR